MRVFISWSGVTAGAVARALRDWLPMAVQSAEVFMSEEDIASGEGWLNRLSSELKESEIALVCLTRESLNSLWVHYEAGAVWKNLDTEANKVCPVLFNVSKRDVTGPLSQFQMRDLMSQAEVAKLLRTMFTESGQTTQAAKSDAIARALYPELEAQLNAIKAPEQMNSAPTQRDDRDVLDEILETVRGLARNAASSRRTESTKRAIGYVVAWEPSTVDGRPSQIYLDVSELTPGMTLTLDVPVSMRESVSDLLAQSESTDWDGHVIVTYVKRMLPNGSFNRRLRSIAQAPSPEEPDDMVS